MNRIPLKLEKEAVYEIDNSAFSPAFKSIIETTSEDLVNAIRYYWQNYDGPQPDHLGNLKHDLRQVYIALSRAVEEGDQLKIGIILGQTISKLETLINQ